MVLPEVLGNESKRSIENNYLIGIENLVQPAANLTSKNYQELSIVNSSSEALWYKNNTETTCSICLEVMDEEEGNLFTIPECKHTFHMGCIVQWKKQSKRCPFCRGTLPEEIGPTLTKRQNWLLEEVSMDITWEEIFENFILCVIWIAYPLCLVCLILGCETTSIGLFVLPFLFMMVHYFFQTEHWMYAIILSIAWCLIYPIVICLVVLAFFVQSLYMFYRILKFYMYVFLCKIRWNYGYSFIILRTMSVTSYWFDTLL